MSFSAPSNGVITQSGSDLDLSGLSGNSGVTITTDQGMTYYDFGVNRLSITGGLRIDPESEVAIFQHDQNVNGDGNVIGISSAELTGWKYGITLSYDSDGNAVATFTTDTTYEVGQSLYFQGVSGDSVDSYRRFNNLPHLIRSVSADTREITLDYKDIGDTLVADGGTRVKSYAGFEFGREITGYGKTRTSRGVGIFITGQSNNNWHPSGYGMSGGARTKFLANGGTIVISRPWSFGSHVEWKDLKLVNPRDNWSPEARGMATGYITNVELVNMSIGNFNSLYTKEFNLINASFFRTYGGFYELPLFNVDTSQNTNGYDYGEGSGTSHSHTLVKAYNPSAGSSFRSMWRNTTGSGAQSNVTEIYRNVSINVKDVSNSPLQDVKVYVKDNPSSYARHSALRNSTGASNDFAVSISNTTPAVVTLANHGFSTGDCVALFNFPDGSGTSGADVVNGRKKITVIDSDSFSLQNFDGSDVVGTISHASGSGILSTATEYNYLDTKEYLNTSDVNGAISEFSILLATQLKDYNTNERSALQIYGGPYDIDTFTSAWKDNTLNRGVSYAEWDTDFFGGFYKVDRRGEGNTVEDIFNFNFCAYDKLLGLSPRSLVGTNTLSFDWILFNDPKITESKSTVDSYSVIDDYNKFYHRAKSYLYDNYAGEQSTLVDISGTTVDLGDNNLVLDPAAATAFDLTDATFSTFSGVFITAAQGNPASQPVVITANTAGNVTIEIVGNDTDTVATLAAAQGATATGDGASEILASGDSNKITVTGGSNPIITIKCNTFTGNLTTTETITIQSGATVLGTVTDVNNPSGLSSRTFSLSNIILGTTIQIYNETQATKRGVDQGYTPTNVYETLVASGTTTDSTLVGDGISTIADLITAAGGLTADPMADNSYVLPSGWSLVTTEVAGSDNRVSINGIYSEGAAPNGDFNIGDSVRVRATCAAATGAFLPFVNSTIANEGGFAIRVNQQPDTIYNNNNIDGSASNFDNGTLTLTDDYANLQIDVSDTDNPGQVTVQEIYAKYAYLITTTDGIEHFFGAMTAENSSNYKINVDVVDLKIQNISASDMIITGARLYRSNGTTIIEKGYLNNDVANGPAGTLSHDTGEFQQFIQPQVESALTAKSIATTTETDAIKKKTNLIPGLL